MKDKLEKIQKKLAAVNGAFAMMLAKRNFNLSVARQGVESLNQVIIEIEEILDGSNNNDQ